MKSLKIKIATPERIVYENDIFQATIPTQNGEITILPNHIPLVSVLRAGELMIKDKNGEQILALAGGFLEIKNNNEITILADNIERVEEIDIARAEEARKRAEEQMKGSKDAQEVDFARLQAVIEREMNRIRVGKKYRRIKKYRQQ